ncbi:MAG: hypothetical protein WCQ77_13205 [Planctomycetota bacterium]
MKDFDTVHNANVTDSDVVREWQEGDPKPFVLRGNAECEQLLATLDSLGVTYLQCIYWRDEMGSDSYCTWPSFKKKGVRFSAKHLESVKMAQFQLGYLLSNSAEESLAGTYEEDADLMVCFSVSVCQERREISAHFKVIESFYRHNDDYSVDLL